LIKDEAIPLLLQVLNCPTNYMIKEEAAWALTNLTQVAY